MIKAFFGILCGFAIGLTVLVRSQSKFEANRNPAAIKNDFDFSHLRGDILQTAATDRLAKEMKIWREGEHVYARVGNFAYRNNTGSITTACLTSSKVKIQLKAEGEAVNGLQPTMEIESPCRISQTFSQMEVIEIPFKQAFSDSPYDGEIQIQQKKQNLIIRFANLGSNWPKKWTLTGINIQDDEQNFAVTLIDLQKYKTEDDLFINLE